MQGSHSIINERNERVEVLVNSCLKNLDTKEARGKTEQSCASGLNEGWRYAVCKKMSQQENSDKRWKQKQYCVEMQEVQIGESVNS